MTFFAGFEPGSALSNTRQGHLLWMVALLGLLFAPSACQTPEEARAEWLKESRAVFELTETDPPAADRGLRVPHYPASNERRIDFFRPYVKDLGGTYIGVGTDQNLTFVAWARSEFAWLMDFDEVAVYVNRIHFFFLTQSPKFEDFSKLWSRKEKQNSYALLQKTFGSAADWAAYKQAWLIAHRGESDVPERFYELKYMSRHFGLKSFHNDPADYQYIRTLAMEGRIQAIPGDLRGQITMAAIAKKSAELKLPVRLLYLSNAEDYFDFPEDMRRNFKALPVDQKSVVIRTISVGAQSLGFPPGEKFPEAGPLHYNVQSLPVFQQWMNYYPKKRLRVMHMLINKGADFKTRGFSVQQKTPADLGLVKTTEPAAGAQ
ncbi:MAG: hypothetical protein KDK39_19325 [Leptospiraceae bacterium]|nr:hypothetical protein [Leptospiraceae bacterium]